MFWKKIKLTISSERTQALLAFVGITIANSVLGLHLDVPNIAGGVSPLVILGANVGAFIVGKSIRPTKALEQQQ